MNIKLKGLPVSAVPLRALHIDINPLRDFRYVANATRYGLCESSICNFVALDSHPRYSGEICPSRLSTCPFCPFFCDMIVDVKGVHTLGGQE